MDGSTDLCTSKEIEEKMWQICFTVAIMVYLWRDTCMDVHHVLGDVGHVLIQTEPARVLRTQQALRQVRSINSNNVVAAVKLDGSRLCPRARHRA
jgi:hypothetical protein